MDKYPAFLSMVHSTVTQRTALGLASREDKQRQGWPNCTSSQKHHQGLVAMEFPDISVSKRVDGKEGSLTTPLVERSGSSKGT